MQSQKAVTAYFTSKQLLHIFCEAEGVIDSGIESIDFPCY